MTDPIPPVDISDWKPAPFDLGGETAFAVGDGHGCANGLRALLAAIATAAAECAPARPAHGRLASAEREDGWISIGS
ncbi:MAG: hypothetical protein IT563_21580 [Alphaproteobacteria bacterium]|nr:hypothetical protein [Alphaproteobacteria bacterium]